MDTSAENLIGLVLEAKENDPTEPHPTHEKTHFKGTYRFASGGRLSFEFTRTRPHHPPSGPMPDPFRSASQEKDKDRKERKSRVKAKPPKKAETAPQPAAVKKPNPPKKAVRVEPRTKAAKVKQAKVEKPIKSKPEKVAVEKAKPKAAEPEVKAKKRPAGKRGAAKGKVAKNEVVKKTRAAKPQGKAEGPESRESEAAPRKFTPQEMANRQRGRGVPAQAPASSESDDFFTSEAGRRAARIAVEKKRREEDQEFSQSGEEDFPFADNPNAAIDRMIKTGRRRGTDDWKKTFKALTGREWEDHESGGTVRKPRKARVRSTGRK